MRLAVLVLLGMGWADAALAAPAPPVPEDFAADHFVAADGCAFQRKGHAWLPHLDRDGQPFCGFPPSLTADAPEPARDPRPAGRRLSDLLEAGLRPGERREDAVSPEYREAPPPAAAPEPALSHMIGPAGLATMRRMQGLLYSGPQRDATCARLGYAPDGQLSDSPGADVTGGLCLGLALAPARPSHPVGNMRPLPRPVSPSRPLRRPTKSAEISPGPAPIGGPAPGPRPDRIGSGSEPHYIETGLRAENARQTQGTARRLAAMGFPVARVKAKIASGHLILAGPFSDRQVLDKALDQLRRNGFPGARVR